MDGSNLVERMDDKLNHVQQVVLSIVSMIGSENNKNKFMDVSIYVSINSQKCQVDHAESS